VNGTFLVCFFSTTNKLMRLLLFVLLRLAVVLKVKFFQVSGRQYYKQDLQGYTVDRSSVNGLKVFVSRWSTVEGNKVILKCLRIILMPDRLTMGDARVCTARASQAAGGGNGRAAWANGDRRESRVFFPLEEWIECHCSQVACKLTAGVS
jgi:hypothetical protein